MANGFRRAMRRLSEQWLEEDAERASVRAAMAQDRTESPAVCPTCGAVLVLGSCAAGHGHQQITLAGLAWVAP